NTDKVKIIVFLIAGVMASFGGLFDSTRIEVVHPLQGEGLALTAIAAVVIGGTRLTGGTGTILGTFLGASIVFTIQDYCQNYYNSYKRVKQVCLNPH
ncbi:MAG TPA: hypothetical protein ENI15_09950, partial [Spirochaetes bacterium]|nr:hypothetical protein [Spirochaetota bacterium]